MDFTVRIAAAAALTGAGALIGRAFSSAARRRASELHSLAGAISQLSRLMIDMKLPLPEALSRAGHELFAKAGMLLSEQSGASPGECFTEAYNSMAARGQPLDCLLEPDGEALYNMFAALGAGSARSQAAMLAASADEVRALSEAAAKKRDEQGKLYMSLGALAGLALSILIM